MATISPALRPTWRGFVSATEDAFLLFEAVLAGNLHSVTRRPHDFERSSLIASGSVFIYEEGTSGIHRWTDGVSWSPSRVLGDFLIYRELDKAFDLDGKKIARTKRQRLDAKRDGIDLAAAPGPPSSSPEHFQPDIDPADNCDAMRFLVGSLSNSYEFKQSGLLKKTMRAVVQGRHLHLVSYYRPKDVAANLLTKPVDTELRWTRIRDELMTCRSFPTRMGNATEGELPRQYGAILPPTAFAATKDMQHDGYILPRSSMPMQQHVHGVYLDQYHHSQAHSQLPVYQLPVHVHLRIETLPEPCRPAPLF